MKRSIVLDQVLYLSTLNNLTPPRSALPVPATGALRWRSLHTIGATSVQCSDKVVRVVRCRCKSSLCPVITPEKACLNSVEQKTYSFPQPYKLKRGSG